MKTLLTAISILLIFNSISYSQWSSDPNVNLQICGAAGEQALPKISNLSNGETYICWFDNRGGSYAVYLQRLNAHGVKQFATDGLLISGNPQSSSLVDYDMITDDSNNAVIAFTDTRNGSSINPFVYKISPSGTFLWGANGISLANDISTYQANPRLAKTTDNSIVVTWIYGSNPNKIAFQKISPGGAKLWGTDPLYLAGAGTENFTYSSIVTSDAGSVIALWSGYSGNFLNPTNYKLYTQKFSSTGTQVWKDTVFSLGRVTGYFVPKIFSDENNGALYVWQDDRNLTNTSSSFVQHFSSAGTRLFPVNGAEGSTETGFNKLDAWAAYMPSTNETYLVWKESNSSQNQYAIYGQRFSSDGTRLWTDNAKVFIPFGQNSFINQVCNTFDTNVVVAFNEGIFGSANNLQKAFITGRNGVIGWNNVIKDISSVTSAKSKVVAAMSNAGMTKIVWNDNRNGAADIYAQNIMIDGQLGNGGTLVITNSQPVNYYLSQNYPNPFNPTTKINYELPASRGERVTNYVSLKVFDVLGNEIATLKDNKQNAGKYSIDFNGSNLSSGIYFYTLETNDFKETKSMLLVK